MNVIWNCSYIAKNKVKDIDCCNRQYLKILWNKKYRKLLLSFTYFPAIILTVYKTALDLPDANSAAFKDLKCWTLLHALVETLPIFQKWVNGSSEGLSSRVFCFRQQAAKLCRQLSTVGTSWLIDEKHWIFFWKWNMRTICEEIIIL